MSLALDTHQFVKVLETAGFTDAQAEAVTDVVRSAQQAGAEEVVTRTHLKGELAELKADILKWMFGAMAFQTLAVMGGVLAAGRLLPG
jgi:hypothetical protein